VSGAAIDLLDEDRVRVDMPSGRVGEIVGVRVVRTCDACGGKFHVWPSQVLRALERGRIGPRFCSAKCFESTRTGPKCTKCGGPNTRGPRTRVCQECLDSSPGALKRERSDLRLAQCPPGKRWCMACDEFLPPAQFSSGDHICTACNRVRATTGHLRRTYGLTDAEYQTILVQQNGRCAICGREPKKRPLAVDHDHKTNVIRGLLCLWCNHRLLAGAHDSVERLRNAIAYLEEPPALAVIGERQAAGRKKTRSGRSR
jgi:hypothetical protein